MGGMGGGGGSSGQMGSGACATFCVLLVVHAAANSAPRNRKVRRASTNGGVVGCSPSGCAEGSWEVMSASLLRHSYGRIQHPVNLMA